MSRNKIDETIPPNLLVHCGYCGDALNVGLGNVYHKGTGWFKQRKGAISGANSGCLVDWADEWACQFCIYKLLHHIPIDQMELFKSHMDEPTT